METFFAEVVEVKSGSILVGDNLPLSSVKGCSVYDDFGVHISCSVLLLQR
jgi:hypothetical protein